MDNYKVEISKIIYGTSRLHHNFSRKKRYSLIKKAIEVGVNHFDTSPYYGYGLAEKELGLFIKKNPDIKISIATKFGIKQKINLNSNIFFLYLIKIIEKLFPYFKKLNYDYSVQSANDSLNKSLLALNVSKIDILFIHEPRNSIKEYKELVAWLEKQIVNKKIRTWGFAGSKKYFLKWLVETSIFPPILQIKSENGKPAELSSLKNAHNISYGYISNLVNPSKKEIYNLLAEVFKKNKNHSIIISTNKLKNLESIKYLL